MKPRGKSQEPVQGRSEPHEVESHEAAQDGSDPGGLSGGILALLLLIFIAVGILVIRKRGSSGRMPSTPPPPEEAASSKYQEEVRSRLRAHHDEWYRYELRRVVARENAPPGTLEALLNGEAPVRSAPVLDLEFSGHLWRGDQKQQAILDALSTLEITPIDGIDNPQDMADRACQKAASEEAIARYRAWSETNDA